jgi:hypothetical protein
VFQDSPKNKQITVYTTITRHIDFVPELQGRLEKIDETSGKTKEQELLEFCQTPRFGREIYEWLGLRASFYALSTFVKPLIEKGKLIMTLPNFPNSFKQRYITAGFEPSISSDEALLDFCRTLRRRKEIEKHFGLSSFGTAYKTVACGRQIAWRGHINSAKQFVAKIYRRHGGSTRDNG